MKRIICIICVLTVLFSTSIIASAAEVSEGLSEEEILAVYGEPDVQYVVEVSENGQTTMINGRAYKTLCDKSGVATENEIHLGVAGMTPAGECTVIVACKYTGQDMGYCWAELDNTTWNQQITCDGKARVIKNNEGYGPRIGDSGGIFTLYNIKSKMSYVVNIYFQG